MTQVTQHLASVWHVAHGIDDDRRYSDTAGCTLMSCEQVDGTQRGEGFRSSGFRGRADDARRRELKTKTPRRHVARGPACARAGRKTSRTLKLRSDHDKRSTSVLTVGIVLSYPIIGAWTPERRPSRQPQRVFEKRWCKRDAYIMSS